MRSRASRLSARPRGSSSLPFIGFDRTAPIAAPDPTTDPTRTSDRTPARLHDQRGAAYDQVKPHCHGRRGPWVTAANDTRTRDGASAVPPRVTAWQSSHHAQSDRRGLALTRLVATRHENAIRTDRGTMVREFEEVTDRLEEGQLSQPFRTQFGWHLVEVIGRRTVDETAQNKRQKIYLQLLQQKQREVFDLWKRRLRDEAYVVFPQKPDA